MANEAILKQQQEEIVEYLRAHGPMEYSALVDYLTNTGKPSHVEQLPALKRGGLIETKVSFASGERSFVVSAK